MVLRICGGARDLASLRGSGCLNRLLDRPQLLPVDAFSYLAVLLSIVLGLGLTQLLTAGGRIIRQRASIRLHWLPILWAAILFLIYLQVWWAMYGFRLRREWSFLSFAIVLAQTALLYLM